MTSYRCELCSEQAEDIAVHLSDRHGMINERELELICCLIKGRQIAAGLNCPITGCAVRDSARLDRHLCRIHKVDKQEKQRLVNVARRQAILYELRALRETFSDPPMVSILDMCGPSYASPPDHMRNITRMLSTFERETCGPLPSVKRRDNARQRAKRTGDFFEFCRRTYGPDFFDTMSPSDALLGFATELYGRNLTVSTVRHYLIDVRIFSSYAVDSSERDPSVTEAKLRHLNRAYLFQMKQMRGELQDHRAESRAHKSARIISHMEVRWVKRSNVRVPSGTSRVRSPKFCSMDVRTIQRCVV
ncbi:hypothetical protein E1301_Tti022676 [Triplophysa tibetana]|uniref:Uncharacterized protein n=1 Tax=Triplophysa tibetana TaxID=1572043 RepID=A0A5A9PPR8_9TELE|nr:hypothetical protein E1301_Tti022676 [Triplophysa tibetana]